MAKKRIDSALHSAAAMLGKNGGKKGGPARDLAISDRRKSEIASLGGKAAAKKRQAKKPAKKGK